MEQTKTPIAVTLRNNGDSIAVNVPLRMVHNGVTYFDTLQAPLIANATRTFSFSDSLVFATSGTDNFDVIAEQVGDQNELNDSIRYDLTVLASAFTLPLH